jgi:Fanconi-associated nuclease 1
MFGGESGLGIVRGGRSCRPRRRCRRRRSVGAWDFWKERMRLLEGAQISSYLILPRLQHAFHQGRRRLLILLPSRPAQMLRESSLSKHNAMVSRKTNGGANQVDAKRPAKRVKLEHASVVDAPDDDDTQLALVETEHHKTTDLETALPQIDIDKDAIKAYEAIEPCASESQKELPKWIPGQRSIYVDAFNLALDTVLEDESHLFDDAERDVFATWRRLQYEAQYLYVRLFLRKTSAWHRTNRLGYHSDISDLPKAVETLQTPCGLPPPTVTFLPVPTDFDHPDHARLGDSFTFADKSEDHITTLEEASSLLLLDELKALARDAKVQGKTKRDLLKALRNASGKQAGLGWSPLKRSDTEESIGSVPEEDSREGTPLQNRDTHFLEKIMAETGPCVRLSDPARRLFERVHLVFYRSREWTEKSLTTIILAKISRLNFPDYLVCRSSNIFASRSMLLEFEASLRIQYFLDSVLEFNGTPNPGNLETILDLCEQIFPRWRELLQEEQQKEDGIYMTGEGAYLRRLSPAWVYTRIIHKGAYVMGKFKNHKREYDTLEELLNQKLFHTSRRGDWYQRKALLEEHYMHALMPAQGRSEEAQKKHWKRLSLQTCEQGLEDRLVHLMYHHDLQKRVTKLEKALRVPMREQHDFSHVRLAKPVERTFYGIRIQRPERAASSGGEIRRAGGKTIWIDPGENENEGECSVEAMCLSQYRALGYRGYHAEGGIVRTLFAYLFFDILFIYIPDVFQTPYQTCPLDLHTDAFYPSRISEINSRLNEISNGEAGNLISTVWHAHFEKQTCVVGLSWSYELEDLLAIARCFAPAALSTVCKVMAQEYGQRGGGVPDLFLWKESVFDVDDAEGVKAEAGGQVMFAEVKSENDRLSDTQRLWIDVLTGAGVRVELCNAVAQEVRIVER